MFFEQVLYTQYVIQYIYVQSQRMPYSLSLTGSVCYVLHYCPHIAAHKLRPSDSPKATWRGSNLESFDLRLERGWYVHVLNVITIFDVCLVQKEAYLIDQKCIHTKVDSLMCFMGQS